VTDSALQPLVWEQLKAIGLTLVLAVVGTTIIAYIARQGLGREGASPVAPNTWVAIRNPELEPPPTATNLPLGDLPQTPGTNSANKLGRVTRGLSARDPI